MPALQRFFAEADEVVHAYEREVDILRHLKPLVEELVMQDSLPAAAFQSRADRFSNTLLYRPPDKSFSVIGAMWAPGQTTPIHDHLTWAVIGVHRGTERETVFRRLDDGRDPGVAKLEKAGERSNTRGHVSTLGSAGIHRIDNLSDVPSMSIHLYGADMGTQERHSYDPVTGTISKFVTGYCNVMPDVAD